MKSRINLVDFGLLLLALSVFAALVVHVVVPSPLRRAVVDEAERFPVEIVVQSDATFLADRMTPGDAQVLAHGEKGIELLAVEVKDGKIRARFRVRARKWRGFVQYGDSTLVPGAPFDFYADRYQYSGIIVDVR